MQINYHGHGNIVLNWRIVYGSLSASSNASTIWTNVQWNNKYKILQLINKCYPYTSICIYIIKITKEVWGTSFINYYKYVFNNI